MYAYTRNTLSDDMSTAAIFVGANHRFHILLMCPHKLRRHFAGFWAVGEAGTSARARAVFLVHQKPNTASSRKNIMAMDNFDISAKSLLSFNLLRLVAAECRLFTGGTLKIHRYYSSHKLLKPTLLYARCVHVDARDSSFVALLISLYHKNVAGRNTFLGYEQGGQPGHK